MRLSISKETRELLNANSLGGKCAAKELAGGRWEIELDKEVYTALKAIDPDVDKAVNILCGVGVGHG